MTPLVVRPQRGPQEAFLSSDADIAIMGGAAGGGKTFGALLSLAQGCHLPGYTAVAFRRTSPELTGGGSIWEESQALYRSLGGSPRSTPVHDWRFPSGALIEFRHLQYEDDVYDHQGKQYAQILFEELTHFTETQFWYMVSRARSTSGVRPFVRATCNPDPDSFVRQLIDWWIDPVTGLAIQERSGVVRWFIRLDNGVLDWSSNRAELEAAHFPKSATSLTFIAARLDDNPALLAKDPDYRTRLESLPLAKREQLLGGNWNARTGAGTLFRRSWFRVVDSHPTRVVRRVRAWDKAASPVSDGNPDPDWTEGARISLTERGEIVIEDFASVRDTPGGVFSLMRANAQHDGPDTTVVIWQDPGQAGLVDVEATKKELRGYHVKSHRAAKDKITNAEVWSPLAERGQILVLRAAWNDRFFRQAEAFPGKAHDDMIDAVSLAVLELGIRPTASGQAVAQMQPGPLRRAYDDRPLGQQAVVQPVMQPVIRRRWE